MNKFCITLLLISSAYSLSAQERTIPLGDIRGNGLYNDKWEYSLNGRELNVLYIDKVKWEYAEESENPYVSNAYRIQLFKKENEKIISYQMVFPHEEDFDGASYQWVNDTVADLKLTSSAGAPAIIIKVEQKLLGSYPAQ